MSEFKIFKKRIFFKDVNVQNVIFNDILSKQLYDFGLFHEQNMTKTFKEKGLHGDTKRLSILLKEMFELTENV